LVDCRAGLSPGIADDRELAAGFRRFYHATVYVAWRLKNRIAALVFDWHAGAASPELF
jgi:hypothetical protein